MLVQRVRGVAYTDSCRVGKYIDFCHRSNRSIVGSIAEVFVFYRSLAAVKSYRDFTARRDSVTVLEDPERVIQVEAVRRAVKQNLLRL